MITNDPDSPALSITIQGAVDRFALIKPAIVSLRGYSDASIKRTVAIRPLAKYPFRITNVEAEDGRFIRFDLKDDPTPGKTGYLLTVENTKADRGSYRDSIIVRTDSEVKPELTLPVYGFVRNRPGASQKSTTQ